MAKLPQTSMSFIDRIEDGSIRDPDVWESYCNRYYAPIKMLVEEQMRKGVRSVEYQESDDVLHHVFNKLWAALSGGKYVRMTGKPFAAYVATIVLNEIRLSCRHEHSKKFNSVVSAPPEHADGSSLVNRPEDMASVETLSAGYDPDDVLTRNKCTQDELAKTLDHDEEWIPRILWLAKRIAFRKGRFDELSRRIIEQYVFEGRDADSVAREFKITCENLRQRKSRFMKVAHAHLHDFVSDGFLANRDLYKKMRDKFPEEFDNWA